MAKKNAKSSNPKTSTDAKESKASKAKPAKKSKAAAKAETPKKLSAIDAAAQVLAKAKQAMNTKEMVDTMAAQGLWTSPGGKTPAQTLYSAIAREITVKGKDARFVKSERGKFAANA